MGLLAEVVKLLQLADYQVNNVDVTVVAQAPKLAEYIPAMRLNLAEVLGTSVDDISIKATTTEGLGFTGTGEGIASYAVCSIIRERA